MRQTISGTARYVNNLRSRNPSIGRWGWGDLWVQKVILLPCRSQISHGVRATSSEAWKSRGLPTNQFYDTNNGGCIAWCVSGEWACPWWSMLKHSNGVLALHALHALSRIHSRRIHSRWIYSLDWCLKKPASSLGRYLRALASPCKRAWHFSCPLSLWSGRICGSSNRCTRRGRPWRWWQGKRCTRRCRTSWWCRG